MYVPNSRYKNEIFLLAKNIRYRERNSSDLIRYNLSRVNIVYRLKVI